MDFPLAALVIPRVVGEAVRSPPTGPCPLPDMQARVTCVELSGYQGRTQFLVPILMCSCKCAHLYDKGTGFTSLWTFMRDK